MRADDINALRALINKINRDNDFDLAWRWCGDSETPLIEVYEEAERHTLCYGSPDDIVENVKVKAPDWDLRV